MKNIHELLGHPLQKKRNEKWVVRELGTPNKNGVIQIKNRFYLFFIYSFVPFFLFIYQNGGCSR